MILSFVFAAMASTTLQTDSISVFDYSLEEVVVTGTRAPKLLKNAPVQTTVISAKDIERSDATNIEDLLREEMPGVEFSYAMNQQTHLNFGGFGGQSVLFLVDGERLAGETMDDVDFSRIEMANVERVEIVRGASSAIYGSNAAGGVINVITKVPQKDWSVNLNGRIARHHSQRYGATVSLRRSSISNVLTAQYSGYKSYNVHSEPNPQTRIISTIYGNQTFNIKNQLTIRPADELKISARAGYFFREIPRITDSPERYRDYSGGIKASWDISRKQRLEIAYSFDQYDKSSYMRLSNLDVRNYSNVVNSVRGIFSHTSGRGNVLTIGADYRYDYLDNSKIGQGSKHEANTDVFVQFDWTISPRWEIVAAARYDFFSGTNTNRVTPKISARFKPTYNTNLRMAYGMGFRTPTLKEKYYLFDMAGIWIVEGNCQLRPESSHNINLSFDWSHQGYSLTITGYYNNVADKIATGLPYYKPGNDSQLYLNYINLNRYDIYGGEASLQARWNHGFSAKLSYAYTHETFPKDQNGNTANNQYIPARRHALNTRIDWQKNLSKDFQINLGLSGRVVSGVKNIEYTDYYDISAGTVEVKYPAYTIWRIAASLLFKDRVKLNLTVDNLFNYKPKHYYLNAPLTDGADIMAGININI